MAYMVPDLPYSYNALETHIDERTMRVHGRSSHASRSCRPDYIDAWFSVVNRTTVAERLAEV